MAKTKVLISGRPGKWCNVARYVHNVDFQVSFHLPVTIFYEIASDRVTGLHNPLCSFGDGLARQS